MPGKALGVFCALEIVRSAALFTARRERHLNKRRVEQRHFWPTHNEAGVVSVISVPRDKER